MDENAMARAANRAKSLQLAEQAGTPFAKQFIREMTAAINEEQVEAGITYIKSLSNKDLLTVWNCLWASKAQWSYSDEGPHGFATNEDWALALDSELSERRIDHWK